MEPPDAREEATEMLDVLRTRWSEVGEKMLTLAREFPEERYDLEPAEGMRSFGEQLRHVAFWNDYAGKALRGETPDGAANTLPRGGHASRAEVVTALARSFDTVGKALAEGSKAPDLDTAVAFLEHSGEHYGQLVVYCRLHGIVPPASRE